MSVLRIEGRDGYIELDGSVISIRKKDRDLLSRPRTTVIQLTRGTGILGKFARPTDGFIGIFEKRPGTAEIRSHHPSRNPTTIVLPKGFDPDELLSFMQEFWRRKYALPESIGYVPVTRKKAKKTGHPSGTQWIIDYSTGYLKDYVVIDIETTGLSPTTDRIIELGAVRYIDDVEVGRFSSLVRPYTTRLMQEYTIDEFEELSGVGGIKYIDDPFITELTGITDEMLEDAPTARQVAPQFFDFIGNLPVVGHNIARFDLLFLRKLATETKTRTTIGHDYFDTMKMAADLTVGSSSKKLKDVGFHLGVYGYKDNHRALDDALYNGLVFQAMREACSHEELEYYRIRDTRSLNALSFQPNPEIFKLGGELAERHFVFTGEMAICRAEAMQRVCDLGGTPLQSITKKANYLVVSEREDVLPIGKIQKAREYMHLGQDLEIITESEFYTLLDKAAFVPTSLARSYG